MFIRKYFGICQPGRKYGRRLCFLGLEHFAKKFSFLGPSAMYDNSALNLGSIQSNLTLLSSNAANIYTRGGKAQFGAKDNDQKIKNKFPY